MAIKFSSSLALTLLLGLSHGCRSSQNHGTDSGTLSNPEAEDFGEDRKTLSPQDSALLAQEIEKAWNERSIPQPMEGVDSMGRDESSDRQSLWNNGIFTVEGLAPESNINGDYVGIMFRVGPNLAGISVDGGERELNKHPLFKIISTYKNETRKIKDTGWIKLNLKAKCTKAPELVNGTVSCDLAWRFTGGAI